MIVKDHVTELKWHYCPPKSRRLWERLLNRKHFRITGNTRVCSNHFVLGRPYGQHLHPCLFMRGYSGKESHKENINLLSVINSWKDATDCMETRQGPVIRKMESVCEEKAAVQQPCSDHSYFDISNANINSQINSQYVESSSSTSPYQSSSYSFLDRSEEHAYSQQQKPSPQTCVCEKCECCTKKIKELENEKDILVNEIDNFKLVITSMQEEFVGSTELLKQAGSYDLDKIKHSDKLIMMHTGLQSYKLFEWLYKTVESKLLHIQYYKGSKSETSKTYQVKKKGKPGPKRRLSHRNELLAVLMKLRLNLSEQFIAHLFGTCTSLISQVLSTWLPFLSYELQPLLHWPRTEELHLYYPDCFKKYKQVCKTLNFLCSYCVLLMKKNYSSVPTGISQFHML